VRSGSSGNLTILSFGGSTILLDAGLSSGKALDGALAEGGAAWPDVSALLVSHLHTDHANGHAAARCARHGVPLWIHEGNRKVFASRILSKASLPLEPRTFGDAPFEVAGAVVTPFRVSHDVPGVCCGFRVEVPCRGEEPVRIALATDLGHGGNGLFERFVDCDLVLLEANHCEEMLRESRRPDRGRVASDEGHLSNRQAATLLARAFAESRRLPRQVVLCHISGDHNTPERALAQVGEILAGYGFGSVPVSAAPLARPVLLPPRAPRGDDFRPPGWL
jgi:phosphoribosyl 1,2-cyclic phosphodiesterase